MNLRHRPVVGQFAKFSAVGVSNTLVDAGVFTLLVLALDWTGGAFAVLASSLGFAAGGTNSYLLNSRVTFRSGYQQDELSAVGRFLVVILSGVLLTALVSAAVLAVQPAGVLALASAKVSAIAVGALWNFSLQRHWVFATRPLAASRRHSSAPMATASEVTCPAATAERS